MLKTPGSFAIVGDPKTEWRTQGYVVSRGLIDPLFAARLRIICDGVLEQWRRRDPQTDRPGDT